ncbi:protein of unknown function [Kyrpidia spormannii]|uniref:Uncharacterized protein n=1 Tax=Kyrpidia spormannii TaxID=2055160 RepID=A0ACA8ZF32_9BACL|nr:protein of unknown function [Kyrpidia spormannii]
MRKRPTGWPDRGHDCAKEKFPDNLISSGDGGDPESYLNVLHFNGRTGELVDAGEDIHVLVFLW